MEVFDAELWASRLALNRAIKKRQILQMQGVKTVVVIRDSQAALQHAAHLEPGPR
jgi:hypothetical protein